MKKRQNKQKHLMYINTDVAETEEQQQVHTSILYSFWCSMLALISTFFVLGLPCVVYF